MMGGITMYVNEQKKHFFDEGGQPWMNPSPSWKQQYDLCNCRTCLEQNDCSFSGKKERFPLDAGGKGQCLRLAQAESDFAFRNVDGRVIVLPEEIVNKIIACLP